MKKLIYISGIVSVNLMLAGALLKTLHIAGAGILLTLSILTFSFGFLPTALVSSYKSQDEKKYKWLYIVTFVVFSIELLGALFKIMHWPYAAVFMFIGIPLPFVLFLPVYLYQTHKNKSNSILNNLGVMFGLTFLAIFSVLLSVNISATILDNFATNSYNNEKSTNFIQAGLNGNAEKSSITVKANELCAYIDELKCELLTATNNNGCKNGKISDDYNPTLLENYAAQTSILQQENQSSRIETLKSKIREFKSIVSTSKNKELVELSNSLFDIDNQAQRWEEKEMPSNHLTILLDVLSRVQSNVRFVEAEYIASL